MEIFNLGRTISSKIVQIDMLENNYGYVVLGTPKLTRNEIYELMDILEHEIRYRDKELNEKVR